MRFFHTVKSSKQDKERIAECLSHIKNYVSEKSGISKFIDFDDNTVAFAGSSNNMKLVLEIYTQKSNGERYLCASVDDDVSWQERDYENIYDFEENISNYISNRVNRIIKTVVKRDSHGVTVESFYLNDNSEWICFEKNCVSGKLSGYFISKIQKSNETIESYHIN